MFTECYCPGNMKVDENPTAGWICWWLKRAWEWIRTEVGPTWSKSSIKGNGNYAYYYMCRFMRSKWSTWSENWKPLWLWSAWKWMGNIFAKSYQLFWSFLRICSHYSPSHVTQASNIWTSVSDLLLWWHCMQPHAQEPKNNFLKRIHNTLSNTWILWSAPSQVSPDTVILQLVKQCKHLHFLYRCGLLWSLHWHPCPSSGSLSLGHGSAAMIVSALQTTSWLQAALALPSASGGVATAGTGLWVSVSVWC